MTGRISTFTDDGLCSIIRHYTREAGVRNLEREIANVCRKVARKVVKEGATLQITVGPDDIKEYLGVIKFRDTKAEEKNEVGLATGLGVDRSRRRRFWRSKRQLMEGKGKLLLTGKLGDVMQESAQAAMSYVRSRAARCWGWTRFLPPPRYSHPYSRRRDSQGRPLGRESRWRRRWSAR